MPLALNANIKHGCWSPTVTHLWLIAASQCCCVNNKKKRKKKGNVSRLLPRELDPDSRVNPAFKKVAWLWLSTCQNCHANTFHKGYWLCHTLWLVSWKADGCSSSTPSHVKREWLQWKSNCHVSFARCLHRPASWQFDFLLTTYHSDRGEARRPHSVPRWLLRCPLGFPLLLTQTHPSVLVAPASLLQWWSLPRCLEDPHYETESWLLF